MMWQRVARFFTCTQIKAKGWAFGHLRRVGVWLGIWLALCLGAAACTPTAALLYTLVPDGTVSAVLSHLEREPETNRRRVAELERAGDWVGLAKFADDNIDKQRSNRGWWLVAGYAYSRQKNHARAIEYFQETVRLEPQAADGWNLLSQEYRAVGELRRALDTLTRALAAVRETAVTWLLIGESHSDLAQFTPAVHAYRQALDVDAGLMPAWAGLARARALATMGGCRKHRAFIGQFKPAIGTGDSRRNRCCAALEKNK